MNAIKKYSGDLSPAILAVNAGNDILITSLYYEHLNAVKEAVYNKTISEETINLACKRIIAWKIKYLINNEKEGKDRKEDENNYTILIICLVIIGILIIGIILYFVLKSILNKKSKESKNEITDILNNEDCFQ